jgi:hypothetical protein
VAVSAVLLASYDPFMLSACAAICEKIRTSGDIPQIIVASPVLVGSPHTFDPRILKVFRYETPENKFNLWASDQNISVVEMSKKLPVDDFSADLKSDLHDSVKSAVVTLTRDNAPDYKRKKVLRLVKKITLEGMYAFENVRQASDQVGGYRRIFIPNGRFPHQKLAELGAINACKSTEIWHYEKGEPPNGMYLRPYAPQNRIESQQDAVDMTINISSDEIVDCANRWLEKRIDPSSNEFSRLWDKGNLKDSNKSDSLCMGIFTSSQDEFVALGPDWQRHKWVDQYHGVESMIQIAQKLDIRVLLRVHPNLSTKSHNYYQDEVSAIKKLEKKFPLMKVYWPDDAVNTYEILRKIDVCVVWDSTVGLEASALGIPTYCLATSRYSLVADVKEVLSKDELPNGSIFWKVNKLGAQRFINYVMRRDDPIDTDSSRWVSWNLRREPILVRISRITVGGGYPTIRDALHAQFDVYRHRALRTNFRAIRRSPLTKS